MMKLASEGKRHGRPLQRQKFYHVYKDMRCGALDIEIENEIVLEPVRLLLKPPPSGRGFPNYPEPPRLVIDKKARRASLDVDIYAYYWLVSERAKAFLEALDPDAFAFLKCDVRVVGAKESPPMWLCDIVRILDAVDEAVSEVQPYYGSDGLKRYRFTGIGEGKLIFQEEVIGSSHIFRMAFSEMSIVCDQQFRDDFRRAALTGLMFKDTTKK